MISRSLAVKTLVRALNEAGDIILRVGRRKINVSFKGPVNLVTQADKAADRRILQILKNKFPDHRYLTEESVPKDASSPYRWIIDPLDGTTNFAHGLPHACVSIGLEEKGRMLAGGVLDPFRKEIFLAVRGGGVTMNGRRIHVSRAPRLIDSLLVTGFPYDRQKRARFYLKSNEAFMQKTQGIRRFGAAALDLAYVACGRFDGFWEYRLKPWDVAAGWLLVEEAGGRVTDYRGGPYPIDKSGQTVATNGRIHQAMVDVLKVFPD